MVKIFVRYLAMEVAIRDNRRLLKQAAGRDVEGEPDELGVRPIQGGGREGGSARCKARLAGWRLVIPDLLGQQVTLVRGTSDCDQVRLRSKYVMSRQIVLPAFSGENGPEPAMGREGVR